MLPGADAAVRSKIVVVLGMHRSGTSLCANLLQALGIDMAEEASPSPANRRGHWERPRINDLNDRVFAIFNRNWNDQAHVLALPDFWWTAPEIGAVQADIIAWLRPRLQTGAHFGFKDPRTARLLPMWHAVFAALHVDPVFIFCVRDPAQVARSIAARDRMERAQSEYRWLIYNADAVTGVGAATVCIIPYEAWFSQPQPMLRRLAVFAGSPRQDDAAGLAAIADTLVDASLRHDDDTPDTTASPLSRRLHRAVVDCVPNQAFSPAIQALCESLGDFERMVQPMLITTEVLRASVTDQNRVIADLNHVIRQLRRENAALQHHCDGPRQGVAAG